MPPCIQLLIENRDLKGIKRLMKTKHAKNLKLILKGIKAAIDDGNHDALKILLTSPLSTFQPSEGKKVHLLHSAINCSHVHVEIFKVLLADHRFDVNQLVQSGTGEELAPLDLACRTDKLELVKLLLEHPKLDFKHRNFIHKAVEHQKIECFRMFVADHRFDVNQIARGKLCDINSTAAKLFSQGLIVAENIKGGKSEQFTPLMGACQLENHRRTTGIEAPYDMEMVKTLLDHPSIDVNFISKKSGNSTLDYVTNIDIARLLFNNRNISHNFIQHMLIKSFNEIRARYINMVEDDKDDLDRMEFQFEIIKIVIRKNLENGFCLKNLLDMKFDELGWMGIRIAEEIEMTIWEEYYTGNVHLSEKSNGNEAFGISLDIWQALLLKCKCEQCIFFKEQYKQQPDLSNMRDEYGVWNIVPVLVSLFADSGIGPSDNDHQSKEPKKKHRMQCVVERKLAKMSFKNELCFFDDYCDITFLAFLISSPMPDVLRNILLYEKVFEEELDGIINGTMPIAELSEEHKLKNMMVNAEIQMVNGERRVAYSVHFRSIESNSIKRKESIEEEINSDTAKSSMYAGVYAHLNGEVEQKEEPEPVEDYSKLCWTCSVTEVKLYKCGGCRKARYCSDKCLRDDRQAHMDYCDKVQEKRKKKKKEIVMSEESSRG